MRAPNCRGMWASAQLDERVVAEVAQQTGLSEVTARVLVARGFSTAEEVERFLLPDLDRDWEDPDDVPGMPEVAERVAAAIRGGEPIVVFGDFDLDGVSAAALTKLGLQTLGADARAIVPHRFREGYGLTEASVERLLEMRPSLVVTVDCGISARREVALLRASGIDVVVTDHHEPSDLVPEGIPIANPKMEPSVSGSRSDLAGAGVALKLVAAAGRRLGAPEAWRSLTDLAALGTIADIVPLLGENRALVADGLERMRSSPRPGIAALAEVADVDIARIGSDRVAFSLAPRLNAAGRMADPAHALELLLEDHPDRARDAARTLEEYNLLRQQVEQELYSRAKSQAEETRSPEARSLVLHGEGCHDGVKGIVASRIAAEFGVCSFLFCVEDGLAVGSGRSVGRVDLFSAVGSCGDLLVRFGGHEAAVGVTVEESALPSFARRLEEVLADLPPSEFESVCDIDAVVELDDISLELAAELERLAPFGFGNPRPLLMTRSVFMNGRQRVGKSADHLKFSAFDGTYSVPAIAFRCADIEAMEQNEAALDIAFNLDADEFRGRRRVQMMVRDLVPHPEPTGGPAAELVEDLFSRAEEILAQADYAGIADADSFHTKLAGVTFEGRQAVVEELASGTPLRIARQPTNEYDPNACAVIDPQGRQVGFFNRRLAAALAPYIDSGIEYDVEVTEITGGPSDAEAEKALGVNVLVTRRAGVSDPADPALLSARRQTLEGLGATELDAEVRRAFLGEREPHDAQREALGLLEQGESCLVVMATGRGKSLIFHAHSARMAIARGLASVFVYPLRALVTDQAFHLESTLATLGLSSATLTGETTGPRRDEVFAALASGETDIVLTTPEFLDLHATRLADGGRVGFVVVDEAHHVGAASSTRRPAYQRLGSALAALGSPQVLAATATADNEIASAIGRVLGVHRTVIDATVRDNLEIADRRSACEKTQDKEVYVSSLCASGAKTIIYVNSREQTVRLADSIRRRVPRLRWATSFYNAGMSREARLAVERAFRKSELSVVVATSAFGEGVNIPDVRNVVLYHMPFGQIEFNQTCGRCGRDGEPAHVHLLFGPRDARLNERILASIAPGDDDLRALYAALRGAQGQSDELFEITNAELAELARAKRAACSLTERGVSTGLGVFRELGLLEGEGAGSYRRLRVPKVDGKVDLTSSARYAEGRSELEEFNEFKGWVLSAGASELLARFNRPILPAQAV